MSVTYVAGVAVEESAGASAASPGLVATVLGLAPAVLCGLAVLPLPAGLPT